VTPRRVVFDEPVTLSLGKYLDDRAGLRAALDAIDALAANPRPAGSVPWGPTLRRLHIGRYRVLYETGETTIWIRRVDRVTR
jgi:mRNA interferase RelE/StbE